MINQDNGFIIPDQLQPYARDVAGLFFYDNQQASDLALLLLHGNGDEADTWQQLWPLLQAQPAAATTAAATTALRLIAPDLPGFGRSQALGAGDLEELTGALLLLITNLGLKRLVLVGSSLGAALASLLVAEIERHTSIDCLGLVVVGGFLAAAVPPAPASLQTLLTPGSGEDYYNGLRQAGIEAAYDSLQPYYYNLAALPTASQVFLRTRVWARVQSDRQRTAFFAALRSCYDLGQQPARAASLAALQRLPVQLLWGEHDQIIPIAMASALQALLPQAEFSVIAGAGHLPQQEAASALAEAVLTFVGDLT
jgi:pimeloyl-ACP methyl ester carboxylesterase